MMKCRGMGAISPDKMPKKSRKLKKGGWIHAALKKPGAVR